MTRKKFYIGLHHHRHGVSRVCDRGADCRCVSRGSDGWHFDREKQDKCERRKPVSLRLRKLAMAQLLTRERIRRGQ